MKDKVITIITRKQLLEHASLNRWPVAKVQACLPEIEEQVTLQLDRREVFELALGKVLGNLVE